MRFVVLLVSFATIDIKVLELNIVKLDRKSVVRERVSLEV